MPNLNYRREGMIIEITIRESSGRKIGRFTYNDSDIKNKRNVLFTIRNKYGIYLKKKERKSLLKFGVKI